MARIPVVSNVTGNVTDEIGTPDYWVRHVRDTVRFHDGMRYLDEHGIRTYLEVGPDATLGAIPTQRRNRPEVETLLTGVAGAYVRGVDVDWAEVLGGGTRIALPTYPFQRQRYWLDEPVSAADVTSAGLTSAGHPLLGAAVPLAEGDGFLLTGRLSLATHPWLADHVVGGAIVLPGTVFVELALRAGEQAGCRVLDELTLEAPVLVPERGGVSVQVAVGDADEAGRRAGAAALPPPRHRRVDQARHRLPHGWASTAARDLADWPPAGATPIDTADLYPNLAGAGLGYGPAFQGLRTAWRADDDLYAEVALPETLATDGFGMHPALLDAALHTIGLAASRDPAAAVPACRSNGPASPCTGPARPPCAAASHRPGTTPSRCCWPTATGAPVLSVASLTLRPIPAEQLRAEPGATHCTKWTGSRSRRNRPRPPARGPSSATTTSALPTTGVPARVCAELAEAAEAAPDVVVVPLPEQADAGVATRHVLDLAAHLAGRAALRRPPGWSW